MNKHAPFASAKLRGTLTCMHGPNGVRFWEWHVYVGGDQVACGVRATKSAAHRAINDCKDAYRAANRTAP